MIVALSHSDLSVRFEDAPVRHIVGIAATYEMGNQGGIPAQWKEAFDRHGAILNGKELFGVAHGFGKGAFTYLIGAEKTPDIDDGDLDIVTLSPGRHAVFEHQGPVDTLPETWHAILNGWATSVGVVFTGGPEYEVYEPRYDPTTPGGVEIWMPVRSPS